MPNSNRLSVLCVPAFSDNYLWVLHRDGRAIVVDPGDAGPVQRALDAHQLRLESILVTHHHPDHIGGIAALCADTPVPVLGPAAESQRITTLTRKLADGDEIEVLGSRVQVIGVSGHTLGHIAYHFPDDGLLFCGDTLFSAGCGRLFEGTPAQMLASLTRISALPDSTAVYCAHEYTQANLAFAATVEPGNQALADYSGQVAELRRQGSPSIPSRIGIEKQINPFLRTGLASIRRSMEQHVGQALNEEIAVFTVLRKWKDDFRTPQAT